jgi:hypothetical protein
MRSAVLWSRSLNICTLIAWLAAVRGHRVHVAAAAGGVEYAEWNGYRAGLDYQAEVQGHW